VEKADNILQPFFFAAHTRKIIISGEKEQLLVNHVIF
jgi:hypothetical protein